MNDSPGWFAALPVDRPFVLAATLLLVTGAVGRNLLSRRAPGHRLIQAAHAVESSFVALLLAAMLLLSFIQIVLRNVANTGILWVDPLLRVLLLWVGFTGAALATRLDRHINIDAVSRVMPPGMHRVARVATHAFAALICLLLANACLKMVREEAGAGTVSLLSIPTWRLQLVMPVTLLVMSYRFLRHLVPRGETPVVPPLLEGRA